MSRGVKTVNHCTLNPFRNSELYTLACDFAKEKPGDPINITVLSIVGVNRIIIWTNKRKKKSTYNADSIKAPSQKGIVCLLKVLACFKPQLRSVPSMFIWSYTNGATRHTSELAFASVNRCHDTWYDHNINTKMFNLGSEYYCMDLYAAAYICIFLPTVSRTHA